MSAEVCVVGSFIMDLTVRAERRPQPGETVFGERFDMFLGGKGFNQAVAARRAGASTAFVGCLGDDDFAMRFRDALADEAIDAEHVVVDVAAGTGVGLPLVEADGQNSIVIVPRANSLLTAEHVDRSRAVIEGARVLLLQFEVALEASLQAARLAHAAGVRVLVNPAPFTKVPDELLRLADVVIPNEVELGAMAGSTGDGHAGPNAAVIALRAALDTDVVATLGGGGVLVAPQGAADPVMIPGHRVDVADTVGAGDVFCGYLAAALAKGLSILESAELANAAAALAVTRSGSAQSVPHRSEVDEFRLAVEGRATSAAPRATLTTDKRRYINK